MHAAPIDSRGAGDGTRLLSPERGKSLVTARQQRSPTGAFVLVLCGLAGLLAACGGGGGSDSEAAPAAAPPPDSGTTVSSPLGSPPPKAMQGMEYSFVPSAPTADTSSLTYSASNLPPWASFNTLNGQIKGTPSSADLGKYSNIRISAEVGGQTSAVLSFDIDVVATANGSATVSWQSPTYRSDGTPLADLAGFKLYWSMTEGDYGNSITVENPGLTSFMIEQLPPATWYFVATAFDSQGLESSFSNVASKTIL